MPAPDLELLKSLPTTLDQTLGCMTRIFHLFEGHPAFMGRRSSSMRIAVDSPGHSQLRTQAASHSSRHDRRNATTMDKKTVSQHHKSYSDISDLAATPSRTFTEFRTNNGDSIEPKPAFSDGTVDALAFYNYESLRAAAMDSRRRSDLDHREYSKRSSTSPKRGLPKTRQVHSDSQQSATFPKANTSDQEGSRNLPRSNSIYARGLEASELLQWKDGLRSSASPSRRVTNKSPAKLLSHHSSPERRVEPKIKDRGRSLRSPKKLFGEAEFKESPGASDFRESLRPFMERDNRASRLTDSSGGRNIDSRDLSVNVIARLMGLEEIPSSLASSKVTKCRGDKFFRGLVQFDPQTMRGSSPPPPCQSKKHHQGYNRVQEDQFNYPAQYNMEQGLCCCEEDRDYEHLRRPFLSFQHEATNKEGLPPNLADAFQAEDAEQGAICPLKQSTQKKKMLWKILQAMRPKVLLKISRRKQTQPEISPVRKNIAQPIQQIKSVSQLSDKEESARDTNSIKQVQVQVQEQEQQTESSNSTESSIVKPCSLPLEETTVVVVKPADNIILSNARSQVSNARSEQVSNGDIFQVREVETAESSNSNDKEMCPTGRGTQINNQANGQRKATKSRVAAPHTESTLESDCETDPSSITQHEKADNVRESRKMRTTTTTRSDSRSPTPDTRRRQGRAASPEARPSLPRSSDHIRGADTVGRKSLVANGKKDGRPAAKAQFTKEEILKRRVIESPVSTSKLRGSNESTHKKETFPIRAAGAKARSQGAVRLKKSNEGAEPPKEIRPVTTDPVTPDASNSDVQTQPASAQPQTSESEPAVQGPKRGTFKEAPVCQLSEVQMIERVSADDQCEQPSNSGACIAISDEPQPLLQIQEAIEELTTPRGVQFNHGKLDDKLAEEMDRPSPVSVLDTTPFDEELTLSPTSSSKHNVEPMQDSVATYNDEEAKACSQETPATLEADLDEVFSTSAQAHTGTETFQFSDAEPDQDKQSFEIADNSVVNKTKQQSSFEFPGTETMINERLLQSLQSNGVLQENDHLLLLDCLEEIMERILESQSDLRLWAGLPHETLCEKPKGKKLEHELWLEIQNMKRKTSSSSENDDICDAVHHLLLQNLLRCQGPQWSTFHTDREKIGLDMEAMIVGDLIEEAVGDLCALHCHKKEPLETTRRQLFTD